MIFSPKKSKPAKHESNGDTYRAKKNPRKALVSYKKALECGGESAVLYDKMIDTLNEFENQWSEEEFSDSLTWSMKKLELTDPTFKRIHARAEPEFKEITLLIRKMLAAKTPADETTHAEAIVACGERALYPLIDFLLTFKNVTDRMKKFTADKNK